MDGTPASFDTADDEIRKTFQLLHSQDFSSNFPGRTNLTQALHRSLSLPATSSSQRPVSDIEYARREERFAIPPEDELFDPRVRESFRTAPCITKEVLGFPWILTCSTVAFTGYFAYNCSIKVPQSRHLLFSRPERTILLLSLLSQITIFLLCSLTDRVFELVR
jgi:hypothetical protein